MKKRGYKGWFRRKPLSFCGKRSVLEFVIYHYHAFTTAQSLVMGIMLVFLSTHESTDIHECL